MVKLHNIQQRIEYAFFAQAGEPFVVPPPPGVADHSFVVTHVAVPTQEHANDDTVSIFVGNGQPQFCWPVGPMVAAYRRFEQMTPPDHLIEVQNAIHSISTKLAERWLAEENVGDLYNDTSALAMLLKAFNESNVDKGPSVCLLRSITVSPREQLHIKTSSGAPLKMLLRGLLSFRIS